MSEMVEKRQGLSVPEGRIAVLKDHDIILLRVLFSVMGGPAHQHDTFPALPEHAGGAGTDFIGDKVRLVQEGKVRLGPLKSRHFAFREYLQAYEYIDRNRENTMKVLIDVDPDETEEG